MRMIRDSGTARQRGDAPTARKAAWGRGAIAVLMVGVLCVALVTVAIGRNRVRAWAVEDAVRTARFVISLTVERSLDNTAFVGAPLSPAAKIDLDADVRQLVKDHHVVGIEVWDREGRLVYADPGHLTSEERLPQAELQKALAQPVVVRFNHQSTRGVPVAEIFLSDEKDTGISYGIIEVSLPASHITDQVDQAIKLLYAAIGLAVLLVAWSLRRMHQRLVRSHYWTEHDELTGLGNRLMLTRRVAEAGRANDRGGTRGLLMVDLDHFKRVNDALGHAVGDELLVAVGARLRRAVRRDDTVVRLGGDEFAVLLSGLPTPGVAQRVGEDLLEALTEPVLLREGVSLAIDASVGIALDSDGLPFGEMMRRADVAMYQAKAAGDGIRQYDPATDKNASEELALLAELGPAIGNGELVLHYQPKIDAAGQLSGLEALVRWAHPTRGFLQPGVFLPAAEYTTLIGTLTTWVLGEAARQAAEWHTSGLHAPIAVNISPRTLIHDDVTGQVLRVLADHRLHPSALSIEITETAIMADPDGARRILSQLRAEGIKVSIDDFGSGYTSLSQLKHLDVAELKIDRIFIQDLLSSSADMTIVSNLIRLAHQLGLLVVAEGVETPETWHELHRLGCDEVQGYGIARPLPADQVLDWTRQWRLDPQTHNAATGAPTDHV